MAPWCVQPFGTWSANQAVNKMVRQVVFHTSERVWAPLAWPAEGRRTLWEGRKQCQTSHAPGAENWPQLSVGARPRCFAVGCQAGPRALLDEPGGISRRPFQLKPIWVTGSGLSSYARQWHKRGARLRWPAGELMADRSFSHGTGFGASRGMSHHAVGHTQRAVMRSTVSYFTQSTRPITHQRI